MRTRPAPDALRRGLVLAAISACTLGDTCVVESFQVIFERFGEGTAARATPDGGYILAGHSTDPASGITDAHLVKTDAAGWIEWEHTWGGDDADSFGDVAVLPDGSYLAAGVRDFGAPAGSTAYLVAVEPDGRTRWERSIEGSAGAWIEAVAPVANGGCLVAGGRVGSGGGDAYVAKLDAEGTLEWQHTLGGSAYDALWSAAQTSDLGYVVAGESGSLGNGRRDAWLIKLDASGAITWQRSFGGTDDDAARSARPTSDGGFVIAGYTYSSSSPSFGGLAYLVKTDAAGNAEWQQTYPASASPGLGSGITSILPLADGDYLLAGYTNLLSVPHMGVVADGWLARLDAHGGTRWQRVFPVASDHPGPVGFESVDASPLGGFVLAGSQLDVPYPHPTLTKTDESGRVAAIDGDSTGARH
ncbi:MAG: hypothetical protein U0610_24455 [bacterium]